MSLIDWTGVDHLNENWMADVHGFYHHRSDCAALEHHWFANSCTACLGCTFSGCTVHEPCLCTGGLDARQV